MNQVQNNPIQPQDAPIAQHGVDLIQLIGGVALVAIGIFVTGLLWVGQLLLVGVGLFCLASWAFRRHEEHVYFQTPSLFPAFRTGIRLFPTAHYWNSWAPSPVRSFHIPVGGGNNNRRVFTGRTDLHFCNNSQNTRVPVGERRGNPNLTNRTDSHSFNNSQNTHVDVGGHRT